MASYVYVFSDFNLFDNHIASLFDDDEIGPSDNFIFSAIDSNPPFQRGLVKNARPCFQGIDGCFSPVLLLDVFYVNYPVSRDIFFQSATFAFLSYIPEELVQRSGRGSLDRFS